MKKLFLFSILSFISCFALAQVSTLFTIDLAPPIAGNTPDGYNLYLGCDDEPNKMLVGSIAPGSQDLAVSVPNNATVHFCAAGFITDGGGIDNEGPLVFASPISINLASVPNAPQSLDINLRCDFPPSGFVCVVTP